MSFGTQDVFRNVNLNIPDNEKICLVGVNGAGKTTLFSYKFFLFLLKKYKYLKKIEPDIDKKIMEMRTI